MHRMLQCDWLLKRACKMARCLARPAQDYPLRPNIQTSGPHAWSITFIYIVNKGQVILAYQGRERRVCGANRQQFHSWSN